jgi:hypothetical protein
VALSELPQKPGCCSFTRSIAIAKKKRQAHAQPKIDLAQELESEYAEPDQRSDVKVCLALLPSNRY